MMKRIALALTGVMVIGSVGFAADAENTDKTTTDVSKNPITGTKTTTKKAHKVVKGAHGDAKVDVKEVTKEHKDGTVDHTTKVDGKAEDKH